MKHATPIVLAAIAAAGALEAQPYINYRGVVNSASYMSSALPGGAIAQGSIFSIFGRNLGPAAAVPASSYPLGTELGGTSIRVMQGAVTVNAIPIYVSRNLVNAILPSNAPLGTVSVRVVVNGANSNWVPARVDRSSPGLFAVNSGGFGPGVIQNAESATELPVNTGRATARPGQIVVAWATGLGAVAGSDRDAPPAVDSPVAVELFVGGRAATRLYAGRSSCCSGLDQLVYRLPPDAPEGCYVPVQVRAGGVVSNTVTMAIQAQGARCTDPHNPAAEAVQRGGRLTALFSKRFEVLVDIDPVERYTATTERLSLSFREEPVNDLASNPIFMAPPAGSCIAYTSPGDLIHRHGDLPVGPGLRALDAGAGVTIEGSGGRRPVNNAQDSEPYSSLMSGDDPDRPLQFATPGSFRVAGAGGRDVRAFDLRMTSHAPPTWTNRETTSQVRRGESLTVRWTGADASRQFAIVSLQSVDVTANVTGTLLCVADAAAGSFAVPDFALANMPLAGSRLARADAVLFVGTGSRQGFDSFSADGTERGLASHSAFSGRTVAVLPEVRR